jgi:hypothetical protein
MALKRPSRFQTAKAAPVIKMSFIKKEGVVTTLFLQAKKYSTNRRINPLRKMYRGANPVSSGVLEYINEMMSSKPATQLVILFHPVDKGEAFILVPAAFEETWLLTCAVVFCLCLLINFQT